MKLIAKGNTAEVFEYCEDKVCKLFYPGYPLESVNVEFNNAKLLNNMKISVPMCYGQIYIDNRHGLIYEKVKGRNLIDYFTDPSSYNMVILTLVNTHKEILEHECSSLQSYKDFIRSIIKDRDMVILKALDDLPDGNALCHGDFHPGNIMINNDGGIKIIDFMNICRGPKEYDIARTYYLVGYSSLPDDMDNIDAIQAIRRTLAEDYLGKMAIGKEDITPFLSIIERCHFYEMSP